MDETRVRRDSGRLSHDRPLTIGGATAGPVAAAAAVGRRLSSLVEFDLESRHCRHCYRSATGRASGARSMAVVEDGAERMVSVTLLICRVMNRCVVVALSSPPAPFTPL